MPGETTQIPDKCRTQGCQLAHILLEQFGLTASPQCPGRDFAGNVGRIISDRVQVAVGGHAEVVEKSHTVGFIAADGTTREVHFVPNTTNPGDTICRNNGLIESLNSLLEED